MNAETMKVSTYVGSGSVVRENAMHRSVRVFLATFVVLLAAPLLHAQTRPAGEAVRIGDGVYAYRHGNYQSMFVVAAQGVIRSEEHTSELQSH